MFKNRIMKYIFALALLAAPVVGYACGSASAQPMPKITAMEAIVSTPNSLFVKGSYSASTVQTANGPITYNITWKDGAAGSLVSRNVAGLADTAKFGRAPLGKSDTVFFTVQALYTVNGKTSAVASLSKIFTNADNQVPSLPVIVTVDTL